MRRWIIRSDVEEIDIIFPMEDITKKSLQKGTLQGIYSRLALLLGSAAAPSHLLLQLWISTVLLNLSLFLSIPSNILSLPKYHL